jgi:hypothetical protein
MSGQSVSSTPCSFVPMSLTLRGSGFGTTPSLPLSLPPRLNPCPTPSLALWRLYASPWRENSPPPRLRSPCLPTRSQKPPEGREWVHEIKHDGYRLIARRQGNRIRLYTRRGYDWSGKYPRIAEALLALRVQSCIIDGEAVWAGKDGKSDFEKLHSGCHDDEVFL